MYACVGSFKGGGVLAGLFLAVSHFHISQQLLKLFFRTDKKKYKPGEHREREENEKGLGSALP